MADWNEQVNRLWDEWISGTGQESGDPGDFVDWAYDNRRLMPRPQDVKRVLRDQVTQELRKNKKYDAEGGFYYRDKQSVTLFDGPAPIKHYFDTDAGGTVTLRQKATRQRRDAIANHVYRAVCDVDHMNLVFTEDPKLNFDQNFSDDVAEKRAVDIADRDNDDDDEDFG